MIESPVLFWYLYALTFFLLINSMVLVGWGGSNRVTRALLILGGGAISVLFACRGLDVGLDTRSYASLVLDGEHSTAKEVLFTGLAFLSLYLTDGYTFFFLILAVIVCGAFFYSTRLVLPESYPVAIAVLLSTFFFLIINISAIRQGVALGFSSLALAYLLKGRHALFFLFFSLALGFHSSSIVLFFFYAAYIFRKSNYVWALVLFGVFVSFTVSLASVVAPFAGVHPVINKIWWYLSWDIGQGWRLKHFYYFSVGFAVVLFFIRKKLNNAEFVLALWFVLGFVFIGLSRTEEMMADRLFYYSIFPGIMVFVSLLRYFKRDLCSCFLFLFLLNSWFFGTAFIQYPSWFVPPYEAVRGLGKS